MPLLGSSLEAVKYQPGHRTAWGPISLIPEDLAAVLAQGAWKMLCDQVSLPHQADQDVKSIHEQPHHPWWNAVLRIHLPLRPRWVLRLRKDL